MSLQIPIEEYLKPTPSIDCGTKSIKEKTQDLTKGQEQIAEKARSIFYFVRDEIKYNLYSPFYLPEHYRASTILARKEGYCVQKAVLLAALARAVGIPARLRFADIINYLLPKKAAEAFGGNLLVYHAYDELYIDGRWIKTVAAFDIKMCQENRIIPVEFDAKNDSLLHSHNQDGKLHIKYVREHGHYQDVPLNEILDAWTKAYGIERVEWFKRTWGKPTKC